MNKCQERTHKRQRGFKKAVTLSEANDIALLIFVNLARDATLMFVGFALCRNQIEGRIVGMHDAGTI